MLRRRFVFRGTVQGVGFRPTVFRVATRLGLSGFVQNRRSEVIAEVQGREHEVGSFLAQLRAGLPKAARLEEVGESEVMPEKDGSGFIIRESEADRYAFPPVPPDLPFARTARVNCWTPKQPVPLPVHHVHAVRPALLDRRKDAVRQGKHLHALVRAVPRMRPRVLGPVGPAVPLPDQLLPPVRPAAFLRGRHRRPVGGRSVERAISALGEGRIVALQGIGGFHLAADPSSSAGDGPAPPRKGAGAKTVRADGARPGGGGGALHPGRRGPRASAAARKAPSSLPLAGPDAPDWLRRVSDTETLGIMLPYTPLHALLFLHPLHPVPYRHLVMTSGNRASEPIITDPREARQRLAGCRGLFLVHDRRIIFRTDDSVVRAGSVSGTFLLRRSRGYVPRLVRLSSEVKGIVLGLGGDLKSAPSLARGPGRPPVPFQRRPR